MRKTSRVVPLVAMLVVIGLVFFGSLPAHAQEGTLAAAIHPGDKVTVTTTSGERLGGRVVTVTGEAVSLVKDGRTREVRAADVQRVQRRRVGVLVGTIIGAGVGVGLGLAAASYAENEAGSASSAFLAVFAISTGTGLGIDAAINRNRTVYERHRRITVAPVVTPRAAGARVTVTF